MVFSALTQSLVPTARHEGVYQLCPGIFRPSRVPLHQRIASRGKKVDCNAAAYPSGETVNLCPKPGPTRRATQCISMFSRAFIHTFPDQLLSGNMQKQEAYPTAIGKLMQRNRRSL